MVPCPHVQPAVQSPHCDQGVQNVGAGGKRTLEETHNQFIIVAEIIVKYMTNLMASLQL